MDTIIERKDGYFETVATDEILAPLRDSEVGPQCCRCYEYVNTGERIMWRMAGGPRPGEALNAWNRPYKTHWGHAACPPRKSVPYVRQGRTRDNCPCAVGGWCPECDMRCYGDCHSDE